MCKPHWSKVPEDMQREVYRTVGMRGERVDASWAPWWRAAHLAIHHVAKMEFGDRLNPKWIEKELRWADTLEGKTAQKDDR